MRRLDLLGFLGIALDPSGLLRRGGEGEVWTLRSLLAFIAVIKIGDKSA